MYFLKDDNNYSRINILVVSIFNYTGFNFDNRNKKVFVNFRIDKYYLKLNVL